MFTTYFWKGRVALYAILKAMGLGPGDEVIVPGFTCVVVPQAVRFVGARPIYVDIDAETLNLDPKQVGGLITDKTKAIIVQHTFGLPADVDAIKSIVAPRGVKIIEDCAHTLDSLYKEKKVGTLGDAAFFSTQWSKPITTGLGGIAVTNDPDLGGRLEELEHQFTYPSTRETLALRLQLNVHQAVFSPSLYWTARASLHALSRFGLFVGSSSNEELDGDKPHDYEKRMTPFQIAAVKKGLSELELNSAHRRQLANHYGSLTRQMGLRTITLPAYAQAVLLRYPVLVSERNKTIRQAQQHRIEIGDWFVSPLHPLLEGWEQVGYRRGECPVAESVARQVINLPTHPKVDPPTLERVCEFLESIKNQGYA